jgi:hypothetical protein
MKSSLLNLVLVGLVSVAAKAELSSVQQKLSQIAAEMHHYALMTDASTEDLNKLDFQMKSFFSKKMQGTLDLAQQEETKSDETTKVTTTKYWDDVTNKTIAI